MSERVRLDGQRVFVAGGAGDVGEGIVRELLALGAEVLVSSRSSAKLEALEQAVGTSSSLRLVTAGWDAAGLETLGRELKRNGPLDLAVASLGPWWHVPRLIDVEPAAWANVLDAGITAHFLAARTVLPHLRSRGSYVFVNGGAALAPVPAAGPVCVVAAAQLMLKDVLAREHSLLRISTLLMTTPVATRARPDPDLNWVTAEDVGRAAATLHVTQQTSGQTLQFGSRAEVHAFEQSGVVQ